MNVNNFFGCIFCVLVLFFMSCHKDKLSNSDGLILKNAVTDIDGNIYNAVQIGNQVWMAENLRTTHYADGTPIPSGSTYDDYHYSSTEPYFYDPIAYNIKYGYLYNWPAVIHGAENSNNNPSGIQGICPNGWHVPSDEEWNELKNTVENNYSVDIAEALKATSGWNNTNGNNSSGFSAVPAGYANRGELCKFGLCACFWSTTMTGKNAVFQFLPYNDSYMYSTECGVYIDGFDNEFMNKYGNSIKKADNLNFSMDLENIGSHLTTSKNTAASISDKTAPTANFTAGYGSEICAQDYQSFANLEITLTGTAPFTFTIMNMTTGEQQTIVTSLNVYSYFVYPAVTSIYRIISLSDATGSYGDMENVSDAVVSISDIQIIEETVVASSDDYIARIPFQINSLFSTTFTATLPDGSTQTGNIAFDTYSQQHFIEINMANFNAGNHTVTIHIGGCSMDIIVRVPSNLSTGFSVRCVRD